ncbi:carbohydrate ABC transporter permease [Lacrimispora indolis]|uniref:carbohydrate ABC transporter permease n=1 Tax=Lacrimispora indolis TaxID=69825 RepID=UPI00041876A6|nr:carbohydrate ABC transporter permease [[Clostridium] methoxybenzovorans]
MRTAMSKQKKVLYLILMYVAYTLVAFLFVAPIVYMTVSSLKTDSQIVADMSTVKAFLPVGILTFDNFAQVIERVNFMKFFKNSVVVAIFNVSLVVVINAMIGYALGLLDFQGKNLMISLVIALSIIPTEAVIINRFMIANQLRMLNSYVGLALPTVGYPMYIFLYYNHFKGMPRELMEAAIVDGESYGGIFWRIMLPLSKPICATVTIMAFIRSWGDLLWPTLVTRDETYRTLPLALRALSTDVYIFWGQIFAFATLMTIPVFIIFLLFQKQFIQSLTMSGIKG